MRNELGVTHPNYEQPLTPPEFTGALYVSAPAIERRQHVEFMERLSQRKSSSTWYNVYKNFVRVNTEPMLCAAAYAMARAIDGNLKAEDEAERKARVIREADEHREHFNVAEQVAEGEDSHE